MKKSILTFGLFTMLMVLTSFTTPRTSSLQIISFDSSVATTVLPSHLIAKVDVKSNTVSQEIEPGPGQATLPMPIRKLD